MVSDEHVFRHFNLRWPQGAEKQVRSPWVHILKRARWICSMGQRYASPKGQYRWNSTTHY